MTSIPFGAQLIGRTEKALNAILGRSLADRGITEPQWVALTLTVSGDGAARIAEALRVSESVARERLGELAAAGLVSSSHAVTERGLALWRDVRAETGRI